MQNCENEFVQKIAQIEDLIAKKAIVYSRLLTDIALAETMSQIANRRQQSSSIWLGLIGSKQSQSQQQNNRGDGDEV